MPTTIETPTCAEMQTLATTSAEMKTLAQSSDADMQQRFRASRICAVYNYNHPLVRVPVLSFFRSNQLLPQITIMLKTLTLSFDVTDAHK